MKITRRNFLSKTALAAILSTQILPSRLLGRTGVSPSNKINFAIIGNGLISDGHRRYFAASADCQVLAVCDVHKGRLYNAKKQVDEIAKNRKDLGFKPAELVRNDYRAD